MDRVLALIALIAMAAAWQIGASRSEADVYPYLLRAVPNAVRLELLDGGTYAAYSSSDSGTVFLGYVTVGQADGYGGPMKIAVAANSDGIVIRTLIIDQKETPSFIRRVLRSDLMNRFRGRNYRDFLELDPQIDGVSGATYTSRAIASSVRQAMGRIAAGPLEQELPEEKPPEIQIGVPEVTLLLLYLTGLLSCRRKFRYKKLLRWAAMLTGLLVLGFLYNSPLTLANINTLLLGYWPQWQTHLYWYLLLGGIFLVFFLGIKNPYCEWFCPFGAAQECFAAIGAAKPRTPVRYRQVLLWAQRGLALFAVILALLYRNPGLPSYEVFGTLFSLTGSNIQFILLAIVLVAALFIRRPWCSFLCPLRPVTDLLAAVRHWMNDIWLKLRATGAS